MIKKTKCENLEELGKVIHDELKEIEEKCNRSYTVCAHSIFPGYSTWGDKGSSYESIAKSILQSGLFCRYDTITKTTSYLGKKLNDQLISSILTYCYDDNIKDDKYVVLLTFPENLGTLPFSEPMRLRNVKQHLLDTIICGNIPLAFVLGFYRINEKEGIFDWQPNKEHYKNKDYDLLINPLRKKVAEQIGKYSCKRLLPFINTCSDEETYYADQAFLEI